jgi:hypothetical protein
MQNPIITNKIGKKDYYTIGYKQQLIRIISRFSTLPSFQGVKIKHTDSQEDILSILPNKEILIGKKLLNTPILALFAQRFALEWQFWYSCAHKFENKTHIANLAASLVISHFYEILPENDKIELEKQLPDEAVSLIKELLSCNSTHQLNKVNVAYVEKLLRQKSEFTNLPDNVLDIIFHLAKPTEVLLMSGGDSRLLIDKHKLLNKYGCRPFPRPEAFSFSSSTASSISNFAFNTTQQIREKLIRVALNTSLNASYEGVLKEFEDKLQKYLKSSGRKLLTAASGTDIALFFSGFTNQYNNGKITHVLVGSDQTGSGVPAALEGKHFSSLTCLNKEVNKGDLIEGYINRDLIKIPLKNTEGFLKSQSKLDKEVEQNVINLVKEGYIPIVHIIDESKLGLKAPSFTLVKKLSGQFKKRIAFMVDNSQMRMSKSTLNEYLKLDSCFMTITGSKFYTGPPFCGALIFPKNYEDFFDESELPKGLKDYFDIANLKKRDLLNNLLYLNKMNFGLAMRWSAAMSEIERYENVPKSLKLLGATQFNKYVYDAIKSCGYLEYFGEQNDIESRSIHPFYIKLNGKILSHEDCTILYKLLNEDISLLIPQGLRQEYFLAKRKCHIGQPVKMVHTTKADSAVLRINLGSRVISDSWREKDTSIYFQEIEKQLIQVDIILNKIELILKYWDALRDQYLSSL